jgi:glyoxylase-like metal-dependent hydrolase (beta-lactamase superfamily II)
MEAPGGIVGPVAVATTAIDCSPWCARISGTWCIVVKLQQVSESCFAVLNDRNRLCDANSGLVNRGGGAVIDTQADLRHARQMIELFGRVWPGMPKRVINTSENGDHVSGNQFFAGSEIIAHRSVPDRMKDVADPLRYRKLLAGANGFASRLMLRAVRPGELAIGRQLRRDYDFDGIELTPPTTLFDDQHVLDLDGTEVRLIHVGPCHQVGDTIVHVPQEGIVFAGDAIFRQCTPMGWAGSYEKWLQCLDLIVWLDPDVIVPGHGPVCGIEGAMEMKAYLEYVRDESRRCFGQGLNVLDAAKQIELGPYREWRCPARLFANVESNYREFRNEATHPPRDAAGAFNAMYEVATARGMEVEF